MKTSGAKSAFTLIELLVVIAIIAILAAILLPTSGGAGKARMLICAHNLKTIGDSFAAWSQEHNGKLPMQVTVTNGGSLELISSGNAVVHFLTLTNSTWKIVHNIMNVYTEDGKYFTKPYSVTNLGIEQDLLVCPSDRMRLGIIYAKKFHRRTC